MRKIEQQMIMAINDARNWSSGNTLVQVSGSMIEVFLHGNHIATVTAQGVRPNKTTFRQWPTTTTRSRLVALGINATIKNGQAMIDREVL